MSSHLRIISLRLGLFDYFNPYILRVLEIQSSRARTLSPVSLKIKKVLKNFFFTFK